MIANSSITLKIKKAGKIAMISNQYFLKNLGKFLIRIYLKIRSITKIKIIKPSRTETKTR